MSITAGIQNHNPLLAFAAVLAVLAAATVVGVAVERSGDTPAPSAPVSSHTTTGSHHYPPIMSGGRVMLGP